MFSRKDLDVKVKLKNKLESKLETKNQRQKKIIGLVSLTLALLFFAVLTWVIWRGISTVASTPEEFAEYVRSFGWAGYLVMLGIQILQVFVALIPGEVVEIAAGFAFGAFGGTLLCLLGVGIASIVIFLLVKRWGRPLVELFIPGESIDQLRFLRKEDRLRELIFLLYLIPGTPKDLLSYFVGLTRIKLGEFLVISLIARIPSVVSSTVGGSFVSSGDYFRAGVVFCVTALVSLGGALLYKRILSRRNRKKAAVAAVRE